MLTVLPTVTFKPPQWSTNDHTASVTHTYMHTNTHMRALPEKTVLRITPSVNAHTNMQVHTCTYTHAKVAAEK